MNKLHTLRIRQSSGKSIVIFCGTLLECGEQLAIVSEENPYYNYSIELGSYKF